jgi:3-hydroxyisobutyrate dehydrogenase-like beta-hydroxyacid dehydrogenase
MPAEQQSNLPTVGFIGLGNMGLPMAANLQKAGYRLRVFNRSPERAPSLVAGGAEVKSQPAEVAEPGGILITSLANDRVLEEMIGGAAGPIRRLGPGGIHVSMSTISPATAEKLAEDHKRSGVSYLAAPVLGRPELAAAGKLYVFLSGPGAAKEKVQPLLRVIGQTVFEFGEGPASANMVKLAYNFLIAAALESMAEALTLVEKNGIDPGKFADMVGRTLFACPIYQNYGKEIAEERYQPALFKLSLGLKDVALVLQTAASSHTPMPLADVLHDHFLTAMAKGRADLDWAAMALSVREAAGLSPRKTW